MSRPVVLVDCDGVIADFHRPTLRLIEEEFGLQHNLDDWTEWWPHACGLVSAEQDAYLWETVVPGRRGFACGLQTLPFIGALELLRLFATVKCVTSPLMGPYWMYERHKWLMRVAGFTKRDIIFASDKAPIRGDLLVDDAIHNIDEWKAANPQGTAILLEQPWNWRGTPNAERLKPADALLAILNKMVTL